jgi:hypothetical protein
MRNVIDPLECALTRRAVRRGYSRTAAQYMYRVADKISQSTIYDLITAFDTVLVAARPPRQRVRPCPRKRPLLMARRARRKSDGSDSTA